MQNESMQIIKSIIGVLAGIAVIWLLVFAFRENLKQLKAIGKLKYVIWVFAISALTLLLGFLAEGTLIVFGAIGLLALILYIFISDKRGPMTEEEHKALMKEINDPRYQARLEKENREAERDARRAEELINESRYGINGTDTGRRVKDGNKDYIEIETGPLREKIYVSDDSEPVKEQDMYR